MTESIKIREIKTDVFVLQRYLKRSFKEIHLAGFTRIQFKPTLQLPFISNCHYFKLFYLVKYPICIDMLYIYILQCFFLQRKMLCQISLPPGCAVELENLRIYLILFSIFFTFLDRRHYFFSRISTGQCYTSIKIKKMSCAPAIVIACSIHP